jgi:hypothetical protein
MPNPWIIVGVLVALALAGFGGERLGERLNDQAWQKREATINATAAAQITAKNSALLAAEHKRATEINNVAEMYEDQLKEKDNALVAARNAAKSGGLFVHTACPAIGGNALPDAAPGASGRDGQALARLSDADAEFFITEASRADAIVAQLRACQALIAADRATIPAAP